MVNKLEQLSCLCKFEVMEVIPNQSEIVISHLERVLRLTKKLKDSAIDLHGHEYDPHSESWKIVAGSYRHRFLFRWNGRTQVLSVSEAFFEILGSWESDWKDVQQVNIDAQSDGDPFRFVEKFFSTSAIVSMQRKGSQDA